MEVTFRNGKTETEKEEKKTENTYPVEGILTILEDGFGFIRNDNFSNDEETDIRLFSCGNTCYVSLDDVNSVNIENRKTSFVLSGIFFAFAILYVVASTYIMSNADRYPRLVKLFVKEDYIIRKDDNKRKRL